MESPENEFAALLDSATPVAPPVLGASAFAALATLRLQLAEPNFAANPSAVLVRVVGPLLRILGRDIAQSEISETEHAVRVHIQGFLYVYIPAGPGIDPSRTLDDGLWLVGTTLRFIHLGEAVEWSLLAGDTLPYALLSSPVFEAQAILTWAREAQLGARVAAYLQAAIASPSDALINFLLQQLDGVSPTVEARAHLRPQVAQGLALALAKVTLVASPVKAEAPEQEPEAALRAIRQLLASKVDGSRLGLRHTSAYIAVLLDNNGRKQLCRLHLGPSRQVVFFDAGKKETRFPIPAQWAEVLEQLEQGLQVLESPSEV